MEPTTIQAISTVGFPIVAFLLMFWHSTTIVHANTEAIKRLTLVIRK